MSEPTVSGSSGDGSAHRPDGPKLVLVCAITLYRDHVLLLRRSRRETFMPGVWSLPCGKINDNEMPDEAALRELKEEAGIWGDVIGLAGFSWFDSEYHGKRMSNLQLNYGIRTWTGDVTLDPSNDESLWLRADQIGSGTPVALDEFTLRIVRQGLALRHPEGIPTSSGGPDVDPA